LNQNKDPLERPLELPQDKTSSPSKNGEDSKKNENP
jgi:hypothetical protein